VEFSS